MYIYIYICIYQVDIYLLQVNSKDTKTMCEVCPKLTIKTPKRRH